LKKILPLGILFPLFSSLRCNRGEHGILSHPQSSLLNDALFLLSARTIRAGGRFPARGEAARIWASASLFSPSPCKFKGRFPPPLRASWKPSPVPRRLNRSRLAFLPPPFLFFFSSQRKKIDLPSPFHSRGSDGRDDLTALSTPAQYQGNTFFSPFPPFVILVSTLDKRLPTGRRVRPFFRSPLFSFLPSESFFLATFCRRAVNLGLTVPPSFLPPDGLVAPLSDENDGSSIVLDQASRRKSPAPCFPPPLVQGTKAGPSC